MIFKKLSRTAYLVAFTTFLMRVGQFMSLPFLAVYLTQAGTFSPNQIGIVLAASGFFLSVTGLFNGLYVDRVSYRITLIFALFLCGLCYLFFMWATHFFYALLLLCASLGWLRSVIEVCLVSMLAKHISSENLSSAHSARVIAANLGIVLGPLIGTGILAQQFLKVFLVAGLIHVGLGFVVLFFKPPHPNCSELSEKISFTTGFSAVFKDRTLLLLTMINFILWTVYSQLETTIPQYLAQHNQHVTTLFSTMIVVNAVVCIVFQSIVLHVAEKTSFKKTALLGCGLFSLSFFIIGYSPISSNMIIAAALMSLGELCTLPINGFLVLRDAPKHLVASYNGFASLGFLGLFIGPILGGYLLSVTKSASIFFLGAGLSILTMGLYCMLNKRPNIPIQGKSS